MEMKKGEEIPIEKPRFKHFLLKIFLKNEGSLIRTKIQQSESHR